MTMVIIGDLLTSDDFTPLEKFFLIAWTVVSEGEDLGGRRLEYAMLESGLLTRVGATAEEVRESGGGMEFGEIICQLTAEMQPLVDRFMAWQPPNRRH